MTIEIKNNVSIINSEGNPEKLSELRNNNTSRVRVGKNKTVKVTPMAAVFENPDFIEKPSDYVKDIVYRK